MQFKIEPAHLQRATAWPATRAEGIDRLSRFIDRAGGVYASERNYDLGPQSRSNVSLLSPYLRHRLLTEAEVVRDVLAAHGYAAAQSFISEVCWRTYWKGWLEHRPEVWVRYRADVTRLVSTWQSDGDLAKRLSDAKSGATGIACFDAWANELTSTGYLHNHARMWFASIWIFTLKLPWQLGADFFLTHLLDGDPASNTLSWRWVCGLQTTGKTYLARSENIAQFTGGRFATTPRLATEAPAHSEPASEPARTLAARAAPPSGSVAFLVSEDDLSPETLSLGRAEVKVVIVASTAHALSGVSMRVAAFKAAAMDDAAERAARHFSCPVETFDVTASDAAARLATLSGGLPVIVAELPVGPVRDCLMPLLTGINANGVSHVALRRDWDNAFWPHAKRGFFQLREVIPGVLADLGLRV